MSSAAPADAPRPLPRRALAVVALLVGVGLAVLLGYSLDRTAWAFTIYETGQENAAQLGWNAALVLEIAAVALIIGMSAVGVLPEPYSTHVRRWAGPCLAAILAVQVSANMAAGFLRGSLPMYRELAATGMVAGPSLWAAYVVQAALWFSINGIIPLLIFGLSKIEAQLVAALLAAPAGSDQEHKRLRRRWPSWGLYSSNGVSAGSYQLEGDSVSGASPVDPNRVSAGRYQLEKDRGGDVSAPTAATGAPANGVSAGSYQLERDSPTAASPIDLNRVSAGTYQLEKDRAPTTGAATAATGATTAWQEPATAATGATTALTDAPMRGVSAGSYQLEGDSAPAAPAAPANRVSAGTYQLEKDRAPTTEAPTAATEAATAAMDAATAWQAPPTAPPTAATGATTALTAALANGVSADTYQLEKDRAQSEPATALTATPANGVSDIAAPAASVNSVSAGTYQLEKDRAPTTAATAAATDAAAADRSGPQRPAAEAVQIFARSGVTVFVTADDDPALPPQPIYPPPVAVNNTAIYPCPYGCGALLTFSEKGAAKRHQHCKHCPPADATT